MNKILSIIIPVFNEEKTVKEVIEKVEKVNVLDWKKEIIVVNDGSNDNSKQEIEKTAREFNDLKIINLPQNKGKGAAIKLGLEKASGDYVLIQDADFEYDPNDIPNLLKGLDGKNVVYGSRNFSKSQRGYFLNYTGTRLLNFFINLIFGEKLTDVMTCYKIFPTNLLKSFDLESAGFDFEIEATIKTLKAGYKIKELPIHYRPRKISQGKKIRLLDGIICLWTIIKFSLR